jgi:hypothetical protein
MSGKPISAARAGASSSEPSDQRPGFGLGVPDGPGELLAPKPPPRKAKSDPNTTTRVP